MVKNFSFMQLRLLLMPVLALVALGIAACASTPPNLNPRAAQPLTFAPKVDLDRFMGRWYVIANISYFTERGYVGSSVEYAKRADGDIDDFFLSHKNTFEAPLEKKQLKDGMVEGSNNARLLAKLDAQGYDTTRFRKIPQTAGEIGKPGYQ